MFIEDHRNLRLKSIIKERKILEPIMDCVMIAAPSAADSIVAWSTNALVLY